MKTDQRRKLIREMVDAKAHLARDFFMQETRVHDLSEGGCRIDYDPTLQVGDHIMISIEIDGGAISSRAEVCWTREDTGVGLQFLD